jgi:hypothetical protein
MDVAVGANDAVDYVFLVISHCEILKILKTMSKRQVIQLQVLLYLINLIFTFLWFNNYSRKADLILSLAF